MSPRLPLAVDRFPPPPDALVQGKADGPPLVVVVGPTAAGKSALAMALAKAHRGAIVIADSRQVYQGFAIGTAAPSAAEQAEVPHALVSHLHPRHPYTVAEYQAEARAAIEAFRAQGHLVFLVGGTGLYVRAVVDGLGIPPVPPNPTLRAELEALPDLHGALAEVDPASAARLHPNDRNRLVRALEVYRTTGEPIGTQQRLEGQQDRLLILGVAAPRQQLFERIDARAEGMLAAGWLEEVQGLVATHGRDLPLLETLGYAELLAHLEGRCSLEAALAATAQRTRQYAKRQLTWFRADPRVHWLVEGNPDDKLAQAGALLQAWALAR